MEAIEIVTHAVKALDSKKAVSLNVLRVGDLTVLTDYFVLATATSSTHARALADEVEFRLGEAGVHPDHLEGRATGWLLLDYGSVIVHVFTKETRAFYNLDTMWADGQLLDLSQLLPETENEGEYHE